MDGGNRDILASQLLLGLGTQKRDCRGKNGTVAVKPGRLVHMHTNFEISLYMRQFQRLL